MIETHLRRLHHRPRRRPAHEGRRSRREADPGLFSRGTARQFWPEQLCRREGRDRGVRAHLGDGVRPFAHHSQCDPPGRDDRHGRDQSPVCSQHAEAAARGERLPSALRAGMGLGLPEDVAPLVVFLASDQAADVTGHASELAGTSRARAHPYEKRIAYRSGGWTAEAIAEIWPARMGQQLESYGVELPK